MIRWLAPACALTLLVCPDLARAQMGGRMGGGGRMGRGGETKPEKPRVADQGKVEKRPKKKTRHDTWGAKKPMQFFRMSGYLRMRSDVFYRLNLGLKALTGSLPPFLRPLQAYGTDGGGICSGSDRPDSCGKETILSSNMRLRLAPTLNVHSRVRVRMTLDVFDNLVLGSTPERYRVDTTEGSTTAPISALSETQAVVQAGVNSWYDAVLVKHVWGEVDLPFGRVSFGRMPVHWGLGLVANSGTCGAAKRWTVHHEGDPDRCTDSDHGDTVDRILFATTIPMVNLLLGFAWDFQASGLTTLNLSGDQVAISAGQAYDLTPADDLQQWTVFLGRIDTPRKVRQRLAAGEVVLNYGTRWVFKRQNLDSAADGTSLTGDLDGLAGNLMKRKAFVMMPDLWLRLNWKDLHLEFEGVYKYGWIRYTEDLGGMAAASGDKDLTIQQFGWVLRGSYRFLNKKLLVGLEVGMASGDDRLEGDDGQIHASTISNFPTDRSNKTHSLFHFDPNYRVDLIFFRELMGTVHNAGYLKPTVAYHILDNLTARLDMIYSYALEPVATPGNSPHYGVELDLDLEYRWPEAGFFAGIAYGVFFPLDALHRPTGIYGSNDGFPAKATNAHSVQLRATIKF